MITIDRILCPTDLSELSRKALTHAVALARWYEAEVTLLYVASPAITAAEVPYVPTPWLSPAAREQLRGDLRAFAEAARDGTVPIRIDVAEGNPSGEIVKSALAGDFDLVVMGTHGRNGLASWVVGSVTEEVLRSSPRPVLTVGPGSEPAPTLRFGTILCPVDFSPASGHTAHEAALLAEETESHLVLFHVIEGVAWPPGPMPAGFDRKAYKEYVEETVRRRLRSLAAPGSGDSVQEAIAWGGPAREILRAAREREAGAIVMGAHGGALDSALLGSITHKVVRQAPCPVLVLPARARALAEAEPEPVGLGEEA